MRSSRPVHISGHARQANDHDPTPARVTACLLRPVRFRGAVREPCRGDGAVARVLRDHRHEVVAGDAAERGFGAGGVDFLACTAFPPGCGAPVTNPPYGDGGAERGAANAPPGLLRFVGHALTLTRRAEGQLALLVRLRWTAGRRAAAPISSAPLRTGLVPTRRIRWFETGGCTNSGQHHHAWIAFDAARGPPRPPRIAVAA